MPAKQQAALFASALALHEQASDEAKLKAALSAYDLARAAASPTFPLSFNSAAVCLSLSQSVASKAEAQAYREAAASHLEHALSVFPDNLEALIARAAVEDAFAREEPDMMAAHLRREAACRFLERGAHAEPSDPGVRIVLAEAVVQCAEAASDAGRPMDTIRSVLLQAYVPLNEASWLVDSKIASVSRMGTDPNALQELHKQRVLVRKTRAKVVLAQIRLTDIRNDQAAEELRRAEREIREDAAAETDAEALLTIAELLEVLSELEPANTMSTLDEAISLCRASIQAFEREEEQETMERHFEARTLLGDLCLARARIEKSDAMLSEVVREGTVAYEGVIRQARNGSQNFLRSETLYNLACLLILGTARGCQGSFSERQIAELLKRAVDAGGVTNEDLSQDSDLTYVRERPWFDKLVGYTQRQTR